MENNIDLLKKKFRGIKEELADLEAEKAFMLGKTVIHVHCSAVGKYNKEIEKIKEKIREFETRLQI